jgi:RHS repeat-associated protein
VYFLHDDRLGTPQLATDGGQNVVWSANYQPFGGTGLVTGSITQNLRFPGQYFDVETDWSYNLNRDYVPNSGRYLETDPIGLWSGTNTYRYANANPSRFTDRLGLDDESNNDVYDNTIDRLQEAYGPAILLPSSSTPINNPHPDPNPFYPIPDTTAALSTGGDLLDMFAAMSFFTGDLPLAAGLHKAANTCKIAAAVGEQDPGKAAIDVAQDIIYRKLELDEIQALITLPVKLFWNVVSPPVGNGIE